MMILTAQCCFCFSVVEDARYPVSSHKYLSVVALSDIKAGDELCFDYVETYHVDRVSAPSATEAVEAPAASVASASLAGVPEEEEKRGGASSNNSMSSLSSSFEERELDDLVKKMVGTPGGDGDASSSSHHEEDKGDGVGSEAQYDGSQDSHVGAGNRQKNRGDAATGSVGQPGPAKELFPNEPVAP
jgi:hypothetical protein